VDFVKGLDVFLVLLGDLDSILKIQDWGLKL
jgi:hypothetical protein